MAKDLDNAFRNLADSGRDFSINTKAGELIVQVGTATKTLALTKLINFDAGSGLANLIDEALTEAEAAK